MTSDTRLGVSSPTSNLLPNGYFFESFPPHLRCEACFAPFRRPVTYQPCAHTVCRRCATVDSSTCRSCGAAATRIVDAPAELAAAASNVRVGCEFCTWMGAVSDISKHTCRARQYQRAMAALQRDPASAKAWFLLGAAMPNLKHHETVAGLRVNKRDCYVNSLTADPNNALGWANLATIVGPGGSIAINNEHFTRRDCIVRALSLDTNQPTAWFNLGNSMRRGDSAVICKATCYKDTCYLRAVELDSGFSDAWFNLGLCLERGMVIDYHDREYDAAMCFISALLQNRDFADAWLKLAIVGPEGKTFFGRSWSAKDCVLEALRCNPRYPDAWVVLDRLAKPDDAITVGGNRLTKDEVTARADKARRKLAKIKEAIGARTSRRVAPRRASPGRSSRASSRTSSKSDGTSDTPDLRATTPRTPRDDDADDPNALGMPTTSTGDGSSTQSCVVM